MIESIKVYGKDEKVVIEAETSGTVNGTSVITGTPTYDPVKENCVHRYQVQSENKQYFSENACIHFSKERLLI